MRGLVTLAIVCLLLVGVVLPGCSSSPPTTTLTVFSITEGEVHVMKAGTDTWVEAQVGMVLGPGDMIKTGDDSGAVITFFDGTTVELEAGTEIELVILAGSADTGSTTIRLGQTIGSIIFRVNKIIDPGSSYDVETPTGEASVRGSVMRVDVAEDGTTLITNLQGNVWAISQGEEVQIPEGRECIIRPEEPPELIPESEEVTFADANLEAAVREALSTPEGPIYTHDLAELTSLNADARGISDLSGLEHATGLTELRLHVNQISDISPLAGLTNLAHLTLFKNQISDISPLAGLTDLTYLGLHYNQISDIEPLAGLTSLTYLVLHTNQIDDVSHLSGLTNLEWLYFHVNQVSDISPLANLTSLKTLYILANQISDISPLAGLTTLAELWLGSNEIVDISPLAGLTDLTGISIWGNQISDISPLANLTNLKWLDLGSNEINDISPLAGLTGLELLRLPDNKISDISPLAGLTALSWLRLDGNEIIDISALEYLTALQFLRLDDNQIEDIEPLVDNAGLGEGDEVDLRNNNLTETSLTVHIPALKDRGVTVHHDDY